MKYPYTGLYHFCLHLGNQLARLKSDDDHLNFYLPKHLRGKFGSKVGYITQQPFHKIRLPYSVQADVWHATHQGTDYFPYNLKMKKVLTIHDINFMHDSTKSERKKKKYLDQLKRKIAQCDAIVTISHFTMNNLEEYVDLSAKHTAVIYNGCNIRSTGNIHPPETIPSRPFLYNVSVIAEKKNQHVLPALLKGNDYLLIISGITESEVYKQQIMAEAKRHGVEQRVLFTGSVSENDKQWYLAHCEAFLFPSLSEGFGLPMIEAMYFGKPVIAAHLTSLPEIGGSCSYYFQSFDSDAMQQTLDESLAHYHRENAAHAIRHHALSFSWEQAAKQYLEIYRTI